MNKFKKIIDGRKTQRDLLFSLYRQVSTHVKNFESVSKDLSCKVLLNLHSEPDYLSFKILYATNKVDAMRIANGAKFTKHYAIEYPTKKFDSEEAYLKDVVDYLKYVAQNAYLKYNPEEKEDNENIKEILDA